MLGKAKLAPKCAPWAWAGLSQCVQGPGVPSVGVSPWGAAPPHLGERPPRRLSDEVHYPQLPLSDSNRDLMRIHMRQIKTINGQSGPVLEGKCLLFASGFFFSIKRASRTQNLLAPF